MEGVKRVYGPYPYYGASGIVDYVDGYLFDEELILLSEDGANITDRNYPICFLATGKYWVNNHAHVLRTKQGNENNFICNSLERKDYTQYNTGMAMPKLNKETCKKIPILCPVFEEQKKIGDYFRGLDHLITLHQWKHYRIKKIINSAWEQRKLGDICKMNGRIGFRGYTEKDIVAKEAGGVLTFSPTNIVGNQLIVGLNNTYITKEKYEESPEIKVQNGNILFVKTGSTLGKSALVVGIGEDCTVNPQVVVIKVKPDLQKILSVALTSMPIQKQITAVKIGGAVPTMTETELKNIDLILPQRSDERIKIGQYFKNLDHLITLHQQKYKSLKKLKKFMVKNMFLQVKCKNIEKDR